ncbi:germination protein YpeB [Irregularibacter muris]|uniref:Germination protein YpeB n=1 Tax=Irregularibacter muris TaxID=1796619 RepID=A0AAE3HIV6_9FIRM|nr:germination protein YpeB [Irregularibacter muris]MCR1899483.1 germination protein YpeB [Irregularibacter muris]
MKNRRVITWLLVLAVAAAGLWGYREYTNKNNYRTFLENQYKNDFYSLLNSMESIQTLLAKSVVSQSDEQRALALTEAWKLSDLAQMNLNRLPISHLSLNETSKFLTQLGDFSYSLGKQNIKGDVMSRKQWEDLERLHNNSGYMVTALQKLHQDMTDQSVQFGSIREEGGLTLRRVSDNVITENLTRVEKEMITYPKMIYDGPFSDHLIDIEPKAIKGEGLTRNQGEEKIIAFLGSDKVGEINQLSRGEGVIHTYGYEVVPAGEEGDRRIYVEVSRKGGHVVWMMDSRNIDRVVLSMPKALEKAQDFLEEKGFNNMVPSYSEKYNGVAVFNFAYEQDDVLMYPDLMKVQVALDDGEIIGFESQGYWTSHEKRDIPTPEISLQEAKDKVSERLDIFKERLAIIPTESKKEVLCYEFKGNFQGDTFIVYINALTGEEQQILKVINTNTGDLTM